MPYLLPDSQLTREQRAVVELRPDRHHLVLGPPGSGKTQVLLHRGRWLRDRLKTPPERFKIFVYTNVLSQFLRQSLDLLSIADSNVQTFDDWCGELWTEYVGGRKPTIATGKKKGPVTVTDYMGIRAKLAQVLEFKPPAQKRLDFALVDEGQDLTRDAYRILRALSTHVSVFADARQQIFEGGLGEAEILRELTITQQSAAFLPAYRNSPDVAKLASYFGTRFDGQNYAAKEREKPSFYVAADWDEEVDQIARVLRERMHLNQRTCIIVPQNRDLYGIAGRLSERGIEVQKATAARKGQEPADFESITPKIATYHSAKGLTFDCAILPRLVELNFKRLSGERRCRLLTVGISRATRWVYLSTVRGYEFTEAQTLRQAAAAGDLFIRESTFASAPGNQSTLPEPEGESFL
jgi:superfamily I DNA/RNA helicase